MASPSLLDDLGEEVTGIVAPVSLCMAVTVLLVRLLNPEGISSSNTVLIASIAYNEQSSDSSGKKFGGALLNALIFVGVVAGMTVVLFLLFKYKCYKFIFAYMGFAVFNIFFFITGALFIQVMQVINLHIDAFSLAYGLFNFSIVGTLGLLFMPIPLLAKQVYLIWVGIIVAYIFTFIPEWTAWVILCFMAVYDIVAVLVPGGPLKALVELAIERQQELPALIYEARPAGGRPYVRGWGNRGAAEGGNGEGPPDGAGAPPQEQQQQQQPPPANGPLGPRPVAEGASPPGGVEMRRPVSRPAPMPVARAGGGGSAGSGRRGTGSGGGGGGNWATAATTRVAPGAVEAETAAQSMRPSGDGSEMQQYQPRRAVAAAANSTNTNTPFASSGPRPVGEGLEQGDWLPLPAGAQEPPPGAAVALRARLLASADAPDSDRSSPRSHTSMEPLLNSQRATAAATLERDLRTRDYDGAYPDPAAAGPSNPLAPGAAPTPVGGPSRRSAQAVPGEMRGSGKGGCADWDASQTPGNMGVRAVAPAFDADRLAEAVRRNTLDGELPAGTPLVGPPGGPDGRGVGPDGQPHPGGGSGQHNQHEIDLPDSIKLGLGDFIFYSMLVGRAAMHDYMTVFAAYLAIIAGLGLTLLCLAVFQKALPALPFSIALGVGFYFLTRLTLEPFLVPLATNMAYF